MNRIVIKLKDGKIFVINYDQVLYFKFMDRSGTLTAYVQRSTVDFLTFSGNIAKQLEHIVTGPMDASFYVVEE